VPNYGDKWGVIGGSVGGMEWGIGVECADLWGI